MTQPAASATRARIPKDLLVVLVILAASNFAIGLGAFSLVGMVEPVARAFDVSEAAVGGLLTAYSLSIAVASPILVALTGHVGRRRVVAAGLSIVTLATLLAAVAPGMAVLYPARIAAAVGAGLVTPVSLAIAAALAPPTARGKALSLVFLGITLSQVAGVPVGTWLAYTFGWQVVFYLVAALLAPCLWLVWTRVPTDLTLPPVALSDLGRVLRDPVPMLTVGYTVVFLAGQYIAFTYLPVLLSATMGFGRDGISLVLLLFGLGAPIGNAIGGWMADRFGPGRTLMVVTAGTALCLPVFSLFPLTPGVLYGFILVWSVLSWAFSAPQQLRLVSLDMSLASVLLSLHAASIYIGIATGSGIATGVYATAGLMSFGWVATIVMLGAIGLLIVSERAADRRRLAQAG